VGSDPFVLVGDDDKSCRGLVRTMLELDGYEVGEAADGDEVLHVAAARRPDLLILDLGMPKRGGMDVLAAMRADPRLSDVPVVILTAASDESSESRTRELGAVAYVAKPVLLEDFQRVVTSVLGSRS
jgi:DNA-binding response OmpR family regulator